jgi:uncharacterized protein YjbI with pentapeptide repeats
LTWLPDQQQGRHLSWQSPLQQVLRQCHSRQELLRTARQLGYRLTRADLQNAWLEHHNAAELQGADKASNY